VRFWHGIAFVMVVSTRSWEEVALQARLRQEKEVKNGQETIEQKKEKNKKLYPTLHQKNIAESNRETQLKDALVGHVRPWQKNPEASCFHQFQYIRPREALFYS